MISAAGSWLRFAIQLLTTIVLARILGPAEYGVATVALVFASVSGLLRDSGLSTFVLQRFKISTRIVTSLHYISCGIGLLLAGGMACLGPWLATTYSDDRYILFSAVLSCTFLFCGISAIPTALLARNMNFRILASVDVITVILACGASLWMALAGAGAWALVFQATALAALQCIATIAVCQWRADRAAGWRELRGAIRFSNNVSIVQILNYVSANVDNLIVATFFGTRAAGLYSQAFQLLVLPLQQINGPLYRVFVPTLSRLNRDAFRFRKFFRAIVSVVGFTLWPLFAVLFTFAESIILVLFGAEWVESASIFKVLVFVGLAQSIGYVNTWLFTATGQVRRQTFWTFINKPILIGSFFIGIPWGMRGMATSYAIASLVVVVPAYLVATKKLSLTLRDLLGPMLSPAILATSSLTLSWCTYRLYPPGSDILRLAIDLLIVGVGLLVFVFLVSPIRRRVLELVRLVVAR